MNGSSKQPLRVRDVFVPGGFPQYTYQDRRQYGIEEKLRDALDRLNKFIAVAGPTKCGKTVLVKKMVPDEHCVWVEGGHISEVSDVWTHVLAALKVPRTVTESKSRQAEQSHQSELESTFKPLGIGAAGKHADGGKDVKARATSTTFETVPAKAAVDGLLAQRRVLVIDDFHYLDPQIQSELVRALKPAVFRGLQVILILIPHRMHQAAQAEMDVDGRTYTLPIPEWQATELFSIAESGFTRLRVACNPTTIDALVKECFSSPHIMQDFCSGLCVKSNVREEYFGDPPLPAVAIPHPQVDFFKDFATSISPETFKSLRRGPERTNRKERELTSGGSCDTYEAVLLALHELGGATPVDWAKLRRALQQVLKEVPQQHEVTRALEKMDEIAKGQDGEPVIDYHKGELHLVDPFFRYYLKWNTSIRDDASN